MRRLPLLLAVPALALAACGSSSSSSSTAGSTTTTTSASANTVSSSTVAPTTIASGPTTTSPPGTFGVKPTVVLPDAAATTLVTEDLIVGTGPAAKAGDAVSMQYVGVSFTTKQQFDASWDRGQPFGFTLGGGQVIKGWDQGIVGMQVGGRRELIIPPDLGYGANPPQGASISANDTLVFVVDLVKIGP